MVQRCKEADLALMSVTLTDCVLSAVAKAMFDACKTKCRDNGYLLTKHLETERTGRKNTDAQSDNLRKRVRELEQ